MKPNPNRIAVEALLEASQYPMNTPAIAKALNLTLDQVRNALRGLRSTGRLLNDVSNEGTVYSLVIKSTRIVAFGSNSSGLKLSHGEKAKTEAKEVIYPPGLKITKLPSSPYTKYQAPGWEHARPEGLDHEKTPSRRGDELVAHMPPVAMCVGGR